MVRIGANRNKLLREGGAKSVSEIVLILGGLSKTLKEARQE
jgi:hypothetical protein